MDYTRMPFHDPMEIFGSGKDKKENNSPEIKEKKRENNAKVFSEKIPEEFSGENANQNWHTERQVKKSGSSRRKPMKTYFPDDEYQVLKAFAEENKISESALLRHLVMGGYKRYLDSIVYVDADETNKVKTEYRRVGNELEDVRIQLKRIGVNLNQIAAKLNEGSHYYGILNKDPIDEIRDLIPKVDDAIKKAGEINGIENISG